MLCSATNPNLPGWLEAPATITPRGSNNGPEISNLRRNTVCGPVFRRKFAGGVGELDEGVDRNRLAGDDDQRVDVDRRHVGALLGESRQTGEGGAERGAVDRGLAPERAEQLLRREVVDELFGVRIGERDDAERDVAERLGEHAADAEHHARAELRVAHEPRDELPRSPHHRRDEHRDLTVGRRGRGEQLGRGRSHRVGVAQAEPHQTPFGLVGDRLAAQLHDHRVPDRLGGRDRTVGVAGLPFVEDRHAVARDEPLRRGLRERAHTAEVRPCQYSSRSTRLSSLPESVRGSSVRSSYSRGRL